MYDPFVRACNYALEELSKIQNVGGLPPFTEEKRIVFLRNNDQAVGSDSRRRNSRVKPDIVLLQWNIFKEKIPLEERGGISYADSFKDLCVSKSKWNLIWRDVRSTVEMKIGGLPKTQPWKKNFDADWDALIELAPYVSADDSDQSEISHERTPAVQREYTSSRGLRHLFFSTEGTRSSKRVKESKSPATAESAGDRLTTDRKRKNESEISDRNKTASKRTKRSKSSSMNTSTQETSGSGSGEEEAAGRSGPQELSPRHPVNIQNGIYAAERLSCSPDITHSLNFILRGKIRLLQILLHRNSRGIWRSRERIVHYLVGPGKRHKIGGFRYPRQSSSLPPCSPHHPEVRPGEMGFFHRVRRVTDPP